MAIYYTVRQASTRHIRDFTGIYEAVEHAGELLNVDLNLDLVMAAIDKGGEYRRRDVRIAECQDDQ